LRKANEKSLRVFFHQHNCRSEERIQERIDQIAQAVPATTDAALLKTGTLRIQISVLLLARLRTAIAEFDRAIQAAYEAHPDRFLTESLPGAGPVLEPRLIAALGSNCERFESASNIACCFGIAPVTESSGNSRWVHWRRACSKFLRQTFHEWGVARFAPAAGPGNTMTGSGTRAKVIMPPSLAFKCIRILFRCWNRAYSESRYLEARQRRPAAANSALAAKPGALTSLLAEVSAEWKSLWRFFKGRSSFLLTD
jgi:hypothetical protein